MSTPVVVTNFPLASFEDTISATRTSLAANDPSVIETGFAANDLLVFVLETPGNVTWWKGLELRSDSGDVLSQITTEDGNHGPNEIVWDAYGLLGGSSLTLAKAKLFGIHTGMYEMQALADLHGQRVHFYWERDDPKAGPIVGFFNDLFSAVAAAAEAVATAVESAVNAVAEVISDVVETIGHAIAAVFDALGDLLGYIPLIGGVLRAVFHWLGGAIAATFDFAASALKSAANLVGGVAGGLIKLVGGVVSLNPGLIGKAFGDIAASIVGPVVDVLGKNVELGQAFFGITPRPLTTDEWNELWRVYRGSIALYNIRVVDGFAGLFNVNDARFVLSNTIYLKGDTSKHTLVHEACHVWQYQHLGSRYIADALWAQLTVRASPGATPAEKPPAYWWWDEFNRGHLRWQDFNLEAQAEFLADVFGTVDERGTLVGGKRVPPLNTLGEFYNDDPILSNVEYVRKSTTYTAFARDSIAYVRSRRSCRISSWYNRGAYGEASLEYR